MYFNIELPQGLSYVAGEVIQGTVEIDNPQGIRIKRVQCTIEQGLLADFNVTKPLTIAIDPWKHENDGTIILIDRAQSNP